MAADGQVILEIQADNKPLKATLTETTGAIEKESKKWDQAAGQSANAMESQMSGALKKIAAAFSAAQIGKFLIDFGKQAIAAASDLEEVQNVVDVTFGESAAEINAWAKNAITQFGLTETQAKRFASTMGAMMKSSGIASKDITQMSEDLAGLAADMASFYNLDFDEAFNKIRSGISGETEPLKQLGINMSVANLEAFALAQGLEKAYSKMDQGEQTMLRYQYLMQATADAQGDFNRTSDGFANGLRLLQSNFEALKTTVGDLLLPIISDAISGLNEMFKLLTPETKKTTVLDEFASIDLQTTQKLEDIRATKEKALELVGILDDIKSANVVTKVNDISQIAKGANELKSGAGTNWSTFISGLNGVDGVITASDGGQEAEADLKGLASGAESLTGTPVSTFKYDNLPGKIQALFDKANGVDSANTNFDKLDAGAEKLTKNKTTDFKYENLVKSLDGLEGKTKTASTDVPNNVQVLENGLKDVTTTKDTNFKYDDFEEDLSELESATSEASTDVPSNVATLDSGLTDATTAKDTNFKYQTFENDIEELETAVKDASTKVPDNLGTLDEKTAPYTTDKETGFKYGDLMSDIGELEDTTEEAPGNVSKSLETLDTATQDITTEKKTKFKYAELKKDVEGLQTDVASASQNLPTDVTTVEGAADKLSGEDVEFKYDTVKKGVNDIKDAANDAATNGTSEKLGAVASSASDLANVSYNSNAIPTMIGDVKLLDSTTASNWTSVLEVFNNIPGYTNKINKQTIEDIANAFSGLGGDKAKAWETLMDALGSDLSALSELTGMDENGAAAWLKELKEAAVGLTNEDVNAWNALFSLLVHDAKGADNYLNFEDIVKAAQAMGVADTMMVKVGDQTMTVAQANEMYKESMKRLVQLYPQLNDLINEETGEVIGGTDAIRERIKAITQQQEREVLLYGIQQKRAALEQKFAELPSLRVDAAVAKNAYEKQKKALDDLNESLKQYNVYLDDEGNIQYIDRLKQTSELTDAFNDYLIENGDALYRTVDAYREAKKASEEATAEYERQETAYREASEQYDNLEQELKDAADAQKDGTKTADEYKDAQKKAAEDGVKALTDALKDVNDYIDRTKKSIDDSIDSMNKGFKQLETGAQYIDRLKKEQDAAQAEELKRQQEQYNKTGELKIDVKLTGVEDTVPSLLKMQDALKSQAEFLQDYYKNFQTAKDYGLSDEFLSQFTDITQENAGYLYLIASGGKQEAQKLQAAYDQMAEAKKPLVDSLAETKLKADETFNELVEKAKQAALDLNNTDVAKASMEATIAGVAEGIRAKVPEVASAVDALNAELARLGEVGGNSLIGGGLGIDVVLTGGADVDGSLAVGTDYVPFDNFLAYLHEGEAVLTAEEAAIWRNFKNGGSGVANTIDYGQLSSAIWDSAPKLGGGNVYLDGQSVGRLISAQQATAVRNLERSGWMG